MPDIFLSYSRDDQQRARDFAEALLAEGFDVWWDVALKTGEAYDEVTETALNTAKAVIVLWSQRSVKSRWVRAEATVAQRNRSFVPVMIEDCVRPVMFELTQSADLIAWQGDVATPAWKGFLADLKHRIGSVAVPAAAPKPAPAAPHGSERRLVAVLDCALAMQATGDEFDPEDWDAAGQQLLTRAQKVLEQHDCRIVAGGGRLAALFGAERTGEDDALRAVQAALALIEHVGEIALPGGERARPRIGIDFGPLVIGGLARPPSGAAVEGAARLQLQAAPGSVSISRAVANVAGGYLALERQGNADFTVLGVTGTHTRFELSRARGLSRFVGRSADFDLLGTALDQASAGHGQVVGIMAEAGTGKSRLCFEFIEAAEAQGISVFRGSATAQGGSTPLFAALDLLRSFFGIDSQDDAATARIKIETRATELDPRLVENLPAMFDLLAVPDPERPAPPLDPEGRQRQLLALTRHLLKLAGEVQPTIVLVEDLHWLDPASAVFVEGLVEANEGLRNLLLLNYRPEFRPSWLQNSACRQIALKPLDQDHLAELLADLLGDDPGVAPLFAPIAEKTSGNPYFVEEIVQTLLETGKIEGTKGDYRLIGVYSGLDLPPTVRAVVAARIDRLEARERDLLQLAAVIGPSFSEPLLAAASGLSAGELGSALDNLRRTGFIVEQAVFPVAEHGFKHPLTLESTLASLVKARRRALHATVAGAIEADKTAQAGAKALRLAWHWDEAGEAVPAALWHLRAGEHVVRTDFPAASRHWQRVRALCREAGDNPVAAQLFVGASIQLLNTAHRLGIDLAEAMAILQAGEEMLGAEGDAGLRLVLSMCFSRALCAAGDVGAYLALAQDNHAKAMASGELRLQIVAKIRLCDALSHSGAHREGLAASEAAMALYSRDLARPEWLPDFHPNTFFAFMRGISLTWLGQLDEAERQLRQVIVDATADETPEVIAWACYALSHCYYCKGEPDQALASATRVGEISELLGSPLLVSYRYMAHVWAALAGGQHAKALENARAAVELFGTVEQHWAAAARMLVARALLELGHHGQAAEMAEAAVTGFQDCSIKHFEIEAWGVLARAWLAQGGAQAAAASAGALAKAEDVMEVAGLEVMRPFLAEWQAELAGHERDQPARRAMLAKAAAAHNGNGAPRHARRVEQQLAALGT